MAPNPSHGSKLEQLALKGLTGSKIKNNVSLQPKDQETVQRYTGMSQSRERAMVYGVSALSYRLQVCFIEPMVPGAMALHMKQSIVH